MWSLLLSSCLSLCGIWQGVVVKNGHQKDITCYDVEIGFRCSNIDNHSKSNSYQHNREGLSYASLNEKRNSMGFDLFQRLHLCFDSEI